ncbi:hypothetical protein AAFF_G00342040 [Aldrovandia affinis]|uniref:G-protein coupled receptors family 1 profile domain-containing protein n=1 Tax=Aldrovandia affinis TaxID=143900 RepID=A0AAD7R675_9TELE|nr:hypothetical protein AAFF_G00342040 [Aldrovandia affinis]
MLDIAVGLPANAWVIWLIGRGPKGLDQSELFILNLAAMEVASYPTMPLYIIDNFILYGSFVEPVIYFLFGLLVVNRPLFQCCVCVERYLAVLHPLTFLRYRPLRYRVGSLATVWVIVLVYGGLNIWYSSTYIWAGTLAVVMAVDSFCSISILSVLRRPGPGERPGEGPHLLKRRALTTILIIQTTLVLNYLPSIAMMPFSSKLTRWQNCCDLFPITVALSTFGSFVQPLFYLSRVGRLPCSRKP